MCDASGVKHGGMWTVKSEFTCFFFHMKGVIYRNGKACVFVCYAFLFIHDKRPLNVEMCVCKEEGKEKGSWKEETNNALAESSVNVNIQTQPFQINSMHL